MNELALFAGAGGGILGSLLLGWRTVCAVEIDVYCAQLLMQRQNEGHLPPFPVWDDVCTFDGRPWNGVVDVVSGGFPCQDISSAGRRSGINGPKSGLWREFARVIGEVKPQFVLIENSQHLRTRGLVRVLKDLDRMGYHTARGVFGACTAGAPHRRQRMWIVANSDGGRERIFQVNAQMASAFESIIIDSESQFTNSNGESIRNESRGSSRKNRKEKAVHRHPNWWPVDIVSGVDDGLANRVDRIRATGNGQVSPVVPLVWRMLNDQSDSD